ncbi:MAG TPA: hypothetical protein VNE63_04890, partial [Candidatus Acidoferrales bacterium]|nr:hypothetical protein [Candidatus Acidoferrales bacterium]
TEAFLEGHVRAFAYFQGVPRQILYDNTKLAVAKILGGGERKKTRAFRAGIWRALSSGTRVEAAGIAGLELPAAMGRALERNEQAIRHWKMVAWPDIKKSP